MYLLDTHAVLWFLQGASEALPIRARVERSGNLVSVVSLWEAAIKVSLGKLSLPYAIADLPSICEDSGFELLPIGPDEAVAVASLPSITGPPSTVCSSLSA